MASRLGLRCQEINLRNSYEYHDIIRQLHIKKAGQFLLTQKPLN